MKCLVVTSTRADFGLLRHPMIAIENHPKLELLVAASGTHLSKDHGYTVDEITRAGFSVDYEIPILTQSDDGLATSETLSRAISGLSKAYAAAQPDMIVVLGDRYEIFGAASAATLMRIPIAHLCGGDVTEGAYDEAFRHGISKMAALHFPTHEQAALRLITMGEPKDRIFNIGNTGLDALTDIDWMSKDFVFDRLGLRPRKFNVVTTYHPVTRDPAVAMQELSSLLNAFHVMASDLGIIFTGVNADTGASDITREIHNFAAGRDNVVIHDSLGHNLYMNTVRQMDAVVGNSSSGIYEAPALKTATLDIGPRQKGRPQARSVIHVDGDENEILKGLKAAIALDCSSVESLYGNGGASEAFVDVLARGYDRQALLNKPFVDFKTF